MTVASILRSKGTRVVTTRPEATIEDIAGLFERQNIGTAAVSDDGAKAIGVISERDLVGGLALHGRDVTAMRVGQLMRPVLSCRPGDSLEDIMSRMTNSRRRHLLVVVDGGLCGVISIGDVVKRLLDDLRLENNVLRDAYMANRISVA